MLELIKYIVNRFAEKQDKIEYIVNEEDDIVNVTWLAAKTPKTSRLTHKHIDATVVSNLNFFVITFFPFS